ncbi:PREDICTED: uncharacterized protein LOC103336588 [Prunus mume]|uniref:Uncharacterized protein LOC103336588 n=1 Tax=Prunus mume TaxID=102107 RepID=A0ABM0PD26_PRUMU|nr:PREDICTED: uncharacterized protein LOC103336588 [Prunus mume]
MTALRQDMAKLQEHNNLLSSKVDETQQLLNHQQTQNTQTNRSSQSLQTPHRQKKGKQGAKATPAPSKQLIVPAPKGKPHVPKKEPDWGRLRPGPFTERIRRSLQDRDVQPLRIPFYFGVEDPLTHLHSFQSAIGCKGLSDEGQCLLFPSALTGAALNWFYRLEPGTVDSFDELKQILLNNFMIQTDRLCSVHDLYTVRQKDNEPLREYAQQLAHVQRTDEIGGNPRKAEYFNSKTEPTAQQDEPIQRSTIGQGSSFAPTEKPTGFSESHKRKDTGGSQKEHSKKNGRYDRDSYQAPLLAHNLETKPFTLLNTSYEAVLMNENEIIPKPAFRKTNRQDNRDTEKFYLYHQQNSHNTEDCISLRKIVERLIRKGKLDQYIARPHQAPVPNASADQYDQHD